MVSRQSKELALLKRLSSEGRLLKLAVEPEGLAELPKGAGAWPSMSPSPAAPQLCDLQLLLNGSESQISQLQNRGDWGKHLARSQNVE